ncbi:MAG TPA: hypothetical protein VLT36_23475, partial [Candidatus Dormibacteraeota bacterium]|nr:hypothetical protein [Candidatus Dormibacteraeota bacterium]
KDLKAAQRAAAQHQQVISELSHLVSDIDRCEKTMTSLKGELESANAHYPSPRSTRDDVAYLTALLDCAKQKLAWEKQVGSLQKRAPEILQRLTGYMTDPQNPPEESLRLRMLECLQAVQQAMERLAKATPDRSEN